MIFWSNQHNLSILCFSRRSVRGFSLVELAITLLIIGILSTIGGTKFVEALQHKRVNSAAGRIKADLEMLRQNAISRSTSLTVQFVPATEQYNMTVIPDPNHPDSTYTVLLSAYPYQSEIVTTALGGDDELVFDRYGQPDSGGIITIQAGSYSQTVTVQAETGKVSIP